MASIGKTRKSRANKVSSLDAMESEIGTQVEDLPVFADQLRALRKYRHLEPSDIVFTGSGDSLSSSLFAHHLSNSMAGAYDPYELQLSPNLIHDKLLFLTSISGRTRANIQLARKTKRLAKVRIAVTTDTESPLARDCDDMIRLSYRNAGVLTAGTVSYTASLLALASTFTNLPRLQVLEETSIRARKWADNVMTPPSSGFIFVGAGVGFALSMYGAFKIHEVLGLPADYEHAEELGHSKLFSIRPTDSIICIALGSEGKTVRLSRTLSDKGFNSYLLDCNDPNPILAALQAALSLQHLALRLARRRRLAECAFLSNRKRLRLSSSLIY